MLPILRIIPVGGVLLAIMIVVLALSPPASLNPALTSAVLSARGALMQMGEHPEWRQFLILAATRRADELGRLRDLPDAPIGNDRKPAGKVAGLPVYRSDADPDDDTGSITDTPGGTIPIEIGEPSSTELPVTAPEETPPVIRTPEQLKVPNESRNKGVGHGRRARAQAKPKPAVTFNLFEILFGGQQAAPQTSASAQNAKPVTVRADPR